MSYILDALRKAERDRNLGRTPSLGDVTAPSARRPSRQPSRRVLALLGLIAGLLVLTVLVWPRHPDRGPTPVAMQAAGAAPAQGTVPTEAVPVVPPDPWPAPGPASADPALEEEVLAESIDDLLDEPAAPVSTPTPVIEREPAADPGREPQPEAEPGPESAPMAADPASMSVPADPEPTAPAQPAAAPQAAIPVEPAADGFTPLRDMPSDYRAAFPELRVDVHVYDEDPTRRWALINGQKAIEGAPLREGPRVVEISAEGIAFEFRGRTVLIPLRR